MKRWTLPILRRVLGVILIVFGIIGLFLPLLQGILLILLGLYLVGYRSQWLSERLRRWRQKKQNGRGKAVVSPPTTSTYSQE